jgi:hypothetical protein
MDPYAACDRAIDVGQDTGSPVIDEYDAKMPFAFSGTLNRVEIRLGAGRLTSEERSEVERLKRDSGLRVQ